MYEWIKKVFIKDYKNTERSSVREKYGSVAGIIGILTNFLLFVAKTVVGILTMSIAIIADAVNNLSDAASSVITLVGFRFSNRPADAEHPFGHARFEYVTGLIIALLMTFVGFELGKSSIEKIIDGSLATFDLYTVIILGMAILLKLWLCGLNRNFGKAINSSALTATASDSRNDVISTSAVLVSAVFTMLLNVTFSLDGIVGAGVSLFIIISGAKLIKETVNPLIGTIQDKTLVGKLSEKIKSYPDVEGIHDLVLHNYGPLKCYATAHVEVSSAMPVMESHDLIDNIEKDVKNELDIDLVIHMDPIVTDDEETNMLKKDIRAFLTSLDSSLNFHDFRIVKGITHTNVIFDVVRPYSCILPETEIRNELNRHLSAFENKRYIPVITFDRDYDGK